MQHEKLQDVNLYPLHFLLLNVLTFNDNSSLKKYPLIVPNSKNNPIS